VAYGGIQAVKGITCTSTGEMVCLIGANGAGKTTTLKAIAGCCRPSGGQLNYRAGIQHLPRTLIGKGHGAGAGRAAASSRA
jgi:ABC-type branched-subunit amino acid transport system ATPase component